MRARHPYHLTLRTQGLLTLPSRDPAEVGGLATQCGAMGRAVAEGGVPVLARHSKKDPEAGQVLGNGCPAGVTDLVRVKGRDREEGRTD